MTTEREAGMKSQISEGSEFMRWFEAQHGKRSSALPTHELRHLYADADKKAQDARSLYMACVIYDARVQSALYAWTARQA